ncbi:MAG TPA: pilus assembly protein PilP [Gammaproteobacteria bacterium]
MNTRFFRYITGLQLVLLLAACSSNVSDLEQFIEQTRTKHIGSVEPLPQFKPYQTFVYTAADLRDPFEAAFDLEEDKEQQTAGLRPDQHRVKEPLEHFPLDTLRMVGILEQNKQVWGLVKDPGNLVHRVQVGNYAGQSEGQIVSVSEEKIELIEIVPDGLGGYIERNATLAISED